jgi:hypothetical protein
MVKGTKLATSKRPHKAHVYELLCKAAGLYFQHYVAAINLM